MQQRPFQQVDVFTAQAYRGNPLAVVLDGSDLSTEQMQHFTNWTNLSEATFLLPPTEAGRAAGADYRVRIFCPGRELPFAGHPTLGSCHAWLEAGGQPRAAGQVVQECALGLITLRRDGDRLAFAAPPLIKSGPLAEDDLALIARGLGIARADIVDHAWLQAGGKPAGEYVVQECGIGLVKLKRDPGSSPGQVPDRLAFAAPPLRKGGPLDETDVELIARGLGVPRADVVAHAWCDNGPNWRGVMLKSAEQVLALKPDASILAGLDIGVVGPRGKVGVVGPSDREDIAFEVRAFFPGNNGLAEDPVTGSLNAALAQWLIGAHLAPPRYVAAQGTALGRAGRVHVEQDGDTIWVGGGSVTCVHGEVRL
ncbi:MAG: PhzF family phenazine biosynthesis protein [Burkholderiaceae bacterium]